MLSCIIVSKLVLLLNKLTTQYYPLLPTAFLGVFRQYTGIPIDLDNDANMGALGESRMKFIQGVSWSPCRVFVHSQQLHNESPLPSLDCERWGWKTKAT